MLNLHSKTSLFMTVHNLYSVTTSTS